MTLNWIKNIILFVFLNLLVLSPSLASDRIKGSDIKAQAAIYFSNHGLNLKLALSDKRTFFPCSTPLAFEPRQKDDWSTVLVSCGSDGWNVFICCKKGTKNKRKMPAKFEIFNFSIFSKILVAVGAKRHTVTLYFTLWVGYGLKVIFKMVNYLAAM